ncbi:MAG: YIP1 family protein [Roseinatronobacter sp.]|nr:YIP1 family protein [Roseinatronobacter sp.]
MDLNLATVSALVRLSLSRPREAAARLIALNVPDDARWLGFVIVVGLSVLVGQFSVLLMGDEGFQGGMLFMAMFQTSLLLGMVVAVQGVGRALGGKGSFPDALLLVAWLQFVMLVFQFLQIASLLIMPPLFGMITVISLVFFMFMLTNFVMALHGFASAIKVFVGIIFSFFAMAMVLAILLGMLGLGPGGL